MIEHRFRPTWSPVVVALLAGCIAAVGGLHGLGCTGSQGDPGPTGPRGPTGPTGPSGAAGPGGGTGPAGTMGTMGGMGVPGAPGPSGAKGKMGTDDGAAPLSSLIAITFRGGLSTGAGNIADYVKARVAQVAAGTPLDVEFPLPVAGTDDVRTLEGMSSNVVVSWLEPVTFDNSAGAARFGANADYTAFFGDGWNAVAGASPQWNGHGGRGWIWVNHEYVSNLPPTPTTAPTGQHLIFSRLLRALGVLNNDVESNAWAQVDVDTYIRRFKKQIGGAWVRVIRDPGSGEWVLDRSAKNLRYDASSDTQIKVTGTALDGADRTDVGVPLPAGVVAGMAGNCSGGQTPWGTVLTAEENVQDYYGDLEAAWDANSKLVAGMGFDPGAAINPVTAGSSSGEFGVISDPLGRHPRDAYGYVVEIDPGVPADEYDGKKTAGAGHKKLGALGRARWENAAFAVDSDWKLLDGKPIVIYYTDDRRGGRIWKWVSAGVWTPAKTRTETRALLDAGTIYAAHFAGLDNAKGDKLMGGADPTETAPGIGRWIKISVTSADLAPNGATLGNAGKTIGQALTDLAWNGIGGFASDDDVRSALYTAANKVGIMELNRPEDIEWNPDDPSGTPRLYVAFTNHNRPVALDQNGKLYAPADHAAMSPKRADDVGSLFAMEEANPADPAASSTFKYFVVWRGKKGSAASDAANPDNIMIDREGGVWFGTDGNFGTNAGASDAIYYLDLDPTHRTTVIATFGRAFRVAAMPSDAEATGPSFTPDMKTIFLSVQHPGEERYSVWPPR